MTSAGFANWNSARIAVLALLAVYACPPVIISAEQHFDECHGFLRAGASTRNNWRTPPGVNAHHEDATCTVWLRIPSSWVIVSSKS